MTQQIVPDEGFSGWIDDVEIDPSNPDHITHVTGGGLWETHDASSPTPTWNQLNNGIEENATIALMTPPKGANYTLLNASGDIGVHVQTELLKKATREPHGVFANGVGIDTAWSNPAYIAAIGSPVSFAVQKGLKPFAKVVKPLLAAPAVPIENLAKLALWVPPPGWFMRYLARPENLEPEVRKLALMNVGADVAGGVGRQFLQWIASGRWRSSDERFDYERGLQAVKAPTLLLAGTHDLLAPPESVAHAAKSLGGPTTVLTAGRAHGFREDYGHGDLMLGRHAPEELYPRVIAFLEAHATRV